MTRQRGIAAINALALEPAAHHLRPVEAVLIERVAQLQDQMQPLRIQTVALVASALLPQLPQRFPERGLWKGGDALGQLPAQLAWIPGILLAGWKAPVELKNQLAQVAACKVEFDPSADADALAQGQGQPAAHGIGADQHPLRCERISGLVAAELGGQRSGQIFDAVAADQAEHRTLRSGATSLVCFKV